MTQLSGCLLHYCHQNDKVSSCMRISSFISQCVITRASSAVQRWQMSSRIQGRTAGTYWKQESARGMDQPIWHLPELRCENMLLWTHWENYWEKIVEIHWGGGTVKTTLLMTPSHPKSIKCSIIIICKALSDLMLEYAVSKATSPIHTLSITKTMVKTKSHGQNQTHGKEQFVPTDIEEFTFSLFTLAGYVTPMAVWMTLKWLRE